MEIANNGMAGDILTTRSGRSGDGKHAIVIYVLKKGDAKRANKNCLDRHSLRTASGREQLGPGGEGAVMNV
jgi:hypothetical protein